MATSADPISPEPSVLHKVRSLLSKAESTTFPDEAEALTAKAQQLVDRHAIDRALIAATAPGDPPTPEGRDITVESPYAREKFQLLAAVARANRCRAVFSPHSGTATVVGFGDDQASVEMLYTSLLVQATTAMLERGRSAAARTRRFRQAFLVAFAARIGRRLQDADEEVVAQADRAHGGAVLPVLATRSAEVDARLRELFPDMRSRRVVVRDAAGWEAGTRAADGARLGRDPSLRGPTRGRIAGGRR